ncbi:MAG: hypothetical protein H6914_00950 [Novosphingobium sp.]|nr:hypothetical protein [Novosphingobium sp.]
MCVFIWAELDAQLDRLCAHHDALRDADFGQPPVDRAQLLAELAGIAPSCRNSRSRCGGS